VLLSGGGRTLLNLCDQIDSGRLNAAIPLVIASRPGPGPDRAAARGLHVEIIRGRIPADRLGSLLHRHAVQWVVLAGYLQLIDIPPDYAGRIVNIHPALLPSFGGPGMYGRHVHEAVIASGAKTSGCTVHRVTPKYDEGPIILQRSCPVLPNDTPETLAARVFEQECIAYPEALRILIEGRTPPGPMAKQDG
jgi:folate-dependent phosphoribosylglycinamide formyltransferase PurN